MKYSQAFENWYAENKNSNWLHSYYNEYKREMNYHGIKPDSFKKWCYESEWVED